MPCAQRTLRFVVLTVAGLLLAVGCQPTASTSTPAKPTEPPKPAAVVSVAPPASPAAASSPNPSPSPNPVTLGTEVVPAPPGATIKISTPTNSTTVPASD